MQMQFNGGVLIDSSQLEAFLEYLAVRPPEPQSVESINEFVDAIVGKRLTYARLIAEVPA